MLLFVLCRCPCCGFSFFLHVDKPARSRSERGEIPFQHPKIPTALFLSPSVHPARNTASQTKTELKGSTSVKEEDEEEGSRKKRASKEDASHCEGKKRRISRERLPNYFAVAFERRVGPTFVPAVSGTPVASTNLPPAP